METGGVSESVHDPRRFGSGRHAHCPLCGEQQIDRLVSETRSAESALCASRCVDAWHVLTVLREYEAASEALTTRRCLELKEGQEHAPALSELLLKRWRAGDWTVTPADLLSKL